MRESIRGNDIEFLVESFLRDFIHKAWSIGTLNI